ncbi:MAG: M14 family zinc carboxypeptidase [Melioribacter sp.]|nr:M14 family zinc carboxypeptidase [Melioribacter sp.]
MNEISFKLIYENYEKYLEKCLALPLIKHIQIKNLMEKLRSKKIFTTELIGYSVEGREIFSISLGKGNRKILVWSQMHGNEPTATASIFDLLNFFSCDDEFNSIKEKILDKTKIYFVPMLNPDGAEKFQRENAFNIDLNRDALRKESYESKLLWQMAEKVKPEFAFNLHDQNSYYTAGYSNNSAAISLLAPPSDFEKNITETRLKSMKLIAKMCEILKEFIPNNIARYNDEYEPRAFGDNFIKSGISSILIESGFLKDDINKKLIRKLNFIALLSAFISIADETYYGCDIKEYFLIPENKPLLFDLLLRNVSILNNGKLFKVDIGINREKKYDYALNKFYYIGKIKEIGDLSIYYGIEDYNFENYYVVLPNVYVNSFGKKLTEINFLKLLKDGYGFIFSKEYEIDKDYVDYPINILYNKNYKPKLASDEYANFVIKRSNNRIYIVINGFIQILNNSEIRILNGTVIH